MENEGDYGGAALNEGGEPDVQLTLAGPRGLTTLLQAMKIGSKQVIVVARSIARASRWRGVRVAAQNKTNARPSLHRNPKTGMQRPGGARRPHAALGG